MAKEVSGRLMESQKRLVFVPSVVDKESGANWESEEKKRNAPGSPLKESDSGGARRCTWKTGLLVSTGRTVWANLPSKATRDRKWKGRSVRQDGPSE